MATARLEARGLEVKGRQETMDVVALAGREG